MSELGKPCLKKWDQKIKKKTNQNAACEQKKHYREMEIWFKKQFRPRMNYEWIGKNI